MKNEHYYQVGGPDFKDQRRINFNLGELKVIYNHFIDVLEEYPEMETYRSVCEKIKGKVEDTCNCENFYGVNDITNMELFYADTRDTTEIAIEMNIQSTLQKEDEDVIFFFNPEHLDLMCEVNEKMKIKMEKGS